ncbi:MAG: hypothetical protein SNH41_05585 [Rikenellaceae bacterium]
MRKLYICMIACLALCAASAAPKASTYVDKKGVMRWSDTGKDLRIMGTNYNAPFSYWSIREPIGADQFRAIDEDIYHMARMGLDGHRIHVWECYICDAEGNIVESEQLKLYDYMNYRLKERGMKMYVTPINFFEDIKQGVVSANGGKTKCLSDPSCFPALAVYLKNFLNHVNPYTGTAYKDDPDIVAFEIVNEPSHWKNPEVVTQFVDMMYDAMRETGCQKPILYNMTTAASFVDKILVSKADGGSFQWYPTGLTANMDLKGNYLPYVDSYLIPCDKQMRERGMARFVYEFSPADVGESAALYPAMARAFREAGFQFAAQFSYDPMHAAYANVDFKTHFLNFAYTPAKALGMMIASEVFHDMDMFESFGRYPENNCFGATTLDPLTQRAEYNSAEKFIYSASTDSSPKSEKSLKKIAGVGSSTVVEYSGTGIYIMDRLESGVWRLEVMPDIFWVADPFLSPHVDKEVSVATSRTQYIKISLADLGAEFKAMGLNEGNSYVAKAQGGVLDLEPGVYLLTKCDKQTKWSASSRWENISLGEYYAPNRKLFRAHLLNHTPSQVSIGSDVKVSVDVVSESAPKKVELMILQPGGGRVTIPMEISGAYRYEAQIPEKLLAKSQILNYHINVEQEDGYYLFPNVLKSKLSPDASSRRVYGDDTRMEGEFYSLSVVKAEHPITLLDVSEDWAAIIKKHRLDDLVITPSQSPASRVLTLSTKSKAGNNVNTLYCRESICDRSEDLKLMTRVEVCGRSVDADGCKLKVVLIQRDGSSYGGVVEMGAERGLYDLQLCDFTAKDYTLHPMPFPYYSQSFEYKSPAMSRFDLSEVEKIQIAVEPKEDKVKIAEIEWISFQP